MLDFLSNSGGSKQNRKLRVAYMLSRFPSVSETFVLNEMYWIREHGVEVHIFSMMDPKPGLIHHRAQEMMSIVHYSHLLSWPLIKANLYFLFRSPFNYFWALLWVIKATYRAPQFMAYMLSLFPKSIYFARLMQLLQIDHIHAHFAWTQQIVALIASRLIGLSNSVTIHAFELYKHNRAVVRNQLEAADQIVTISEYNRKFITDLCRSVTVDDVRLIYLGIDMDNFGPNKQRSDIESPHLLSVGSLLEKKGHQYLIAACHLLAQRRVNFHCSIVGEGPGRPELEALIAKYNLSTKVTLLGTLRQDDVCRLYKHSDIFALACVVASSGDRDGMPTVLIEAMATGIPVVSTPVTGIPELVTDGENGLLVPEQDALALADALQTLIEDEELRRSMGRKARQRVVKEFDSQHNAVLLANLFQEVVNR